MKRFILIAAAAAVVGHALWARSPCAAELSSPVTFTDITQAAGIRFEHYYSPEKKYIVESMSGGVALFDFDNDGYLDIYFTNSLTVDAQGQTEKAPSALYRNNGDGTFSDVTERSGLKYPGWAHGVAAGDFDGDGWTDLYVTCLGSNRLYRNNGDGTFADVARQAGADDPRWSTGAAFGDFDDDGDLDLFVANYVDFKLDDLPEFGKGRFCNYRGVAVQCGPRGLPGAGDSLFRNNGDGTFTDVTKAAGVEDPEGRFGLTALWTDLDFDGWLDLYVANDAGPNFLYKNNRDGTFTETAFFAGVAVGEDGNEQGSMGLAIGDYDRNGSFDIFLTHFSDEYNTLYRHDREMIFSDVSYPSRLALPSLPYLGWGSEFMDYDNDGWLDLLVVNGHVYPQMENPALGTNYRQRMQLFRNNRDGTFSEITESAGEALMRRYVSRGAAFGDLDNDGDLDVVVNNLDGAPVVLRNDDGNRNHWLNVRLVGSRKNRLALGARVRVVAGDLAQIAEVRSGGSYISQSDFRLHFGLEKRTRVDLIEVHWPGGGVEKIENVAANQFVVIQEGKGLIGQKPPGKQ
jgi:hypothetical protein